MKIWLLSDLHIDIRHNTHPFQLPGPRPEHDVVVIAGDIRQHMVKGVRWIANSNFDKPVIYVAGNHEFYTRAIDTEIAKAKAEAALHGNIHVLENDSVDIGSVRFIGATLWTDYRLMREDNQRWAMHAAEQGMNDHRYIKVAARGYSRFRAADALRLHEASRDYIRAQLCDVPFAGPKVVVTHHAPSLRSLDVRYRLGSGDLLNCAYASHLDDLVDRAALWLHGHSHHNVDYTRGDGRVLTNQRGYNDGKDNGFDVSFVVEVPTHGADAERGLLQGTAAQT